MLKRIWKLPSLLFHSTFFEAPALPAIALMLILGLAAVYDIKTFTIPHVFSYAAIAVFAITAIYLGFSPNLWGWHLLSAVIAFILSFGLFSISVMGGGDVKLFTALALWFNPLGLPGLILCITGSGTAIGLALVVYKLITISPSNFDGSGLAARYRAVRDIRVPYGPNIAFGTLLFLIFSGTF